MGSKTLTIAQVSATEYGGGAESIARQLHECYRRRGHDATLLVGRGAATGDGVIAFGEGRHAGLDHLLAGPLRILDRQRGLESYHYPRSRTVLSQLARPVDIVHLHNLHGGYFDLRMLPTLSRTQPVVMTLHDAWLLSGHCAHSFDCERWRTGCGACPDLTIYPAVLRDATAVNWQRKREIFAHSKLYVATPSQWLADRVRDSMMAPALADLRVIPNGVDLDTFSPGDRTVARAAVGLADDESVLLAIGSAALDNPFKDFATVRAAAARAAGLAGRELTLVVVGATAGEERHNGLRLRTVPFVQDTTTMAQWYRAADLYVHAARADTFPTAVLEALACGTPVVATAVGGIPEQVRAVPHDHATGALTPAGNAAGMAAAIAALVGDRALRARLGARAARTARERFGAERQCSDYLDWYRSIGSAGGDSVGSADEEFFGSADG